MEMYDLQTLGHLLYLVALISKEIPNSEKSSEMISLAGAPPREAVRESAAVVAAQCEAAFAHFLQQQLFQNC